MFSPRTALLALFLTATTACTNATGPVATGADLMEMRTWDLPAGQAERLVNSLNRVLVQRSGDVSTQVGRAVEGPGGSLVVVAPAGVLSGVETLVDRVSTAPAAPPLQNVDMEYWVVLGTPAETSTRAAELAEVSAALDAIESADGPRTFTLQAARSMRTLDGEWGTVSDRGLEVKHLAAVEPGTSTVVARVEVELPYGQAQVETQLALGSGEIAVLAQTGLRSDDAPDADVYVLVRPTIR